MPGRKLVLLSINWLKRMQGRKLVLFCKINWFECQVENRFCLALINWLECQVENWFCGYVTYEAGEVYHRFFQNHYNAGMYIMKKSLFIVYFCWNVDYIFHNVSMFQIRGQYKNLAVTTPRSKIIFTYSGQWAQFSYPFLPPPARHCF